LKTKVSTADRSKAVKKIGCVMKSRLTLVGALCAIALSFPATANEDVIKNTGDPNNWAQPTGDYANTRYSKLDQINTKNVGSLKTAWTFSTGVLRGHEGSPLAIGSSM
jgi:glucose dehydrogenase